MVIVGIVVAYIVGDRVDLGSDATPLNKTLSSQRLPVIKTLDHFSLTNQLGEEVTVESLKGRPWVANIFFSRCPTFCVQMTQRMKELQNALGADQNLKLVSITTDPEYDQPEVLAKYAKRFGADDIRWSFLTGEKSEIERAIQKELLLAVRENPEDTRQSELDLYTHSSLIVLLDAESRLRWTYESLSTNPVPAILADLSHLGEASRTFSMSLSHLPILNATLNGTSALLLCLGFYFIKRGQRRAHQRCMLAALGTSTLFLISYVVYHVGMQRLHGEAHTTFQDPAWFRPIYLTILVTHLVLAIAIVPLVLVTVFRALKGRFEMHAKIARWTWPIWMYVSVTGVVIYLILYQIFPQR